MQTYSPQRVLYPTRPEVLVQEFDYRSTNDGGSFTRLELLAQESPLEDCNIGLLVAVLPAEA